MSTGVRRKNRLVRVEGSTLCQLRCPTCPTTEGYTHANLGAGFLRSANFQRLVDQFADEDGVLFELSNYGEVLLNPELVEILRIARERNFWISCYSGANLNTAKDEIIESVVKYQMLGITCSIDGASDETYKIYRRRGNFSKVIENIRKINKYKSDYNSQLPHLIWQFVVFGHNEHEIEIARAMAKELNMEFFVKFSWDREISPLRDQPKLVSEAAADDVDPQDPHSTYSQQVCEQLWKSPQINFDGRVLGCCANYWGDFGGDAFDNFKDATNGEKIRYAREMLHGDVGPRDDIPCTQCDVYKARQAKGDWIDRTVAEFI